VLLAVEESLANTTDLPLVLHTCQFFTDVMLQDFPAEVFVQRPSILRVVANNIFICMFIQLRGINMRTEKTAK
jgi:hypothetical protein